VSCREHKVRSTVRPNPKLEFSRQSTIRNEETINETIEQICFLRPHLSGFFSWWIFPSSLPPEQKNAFPASSKSTTQKWLSQTPWSKEATSSAPTGGIRLEHTTITANLFEAARVNRHYRCDRTSKSSVVTLIM